VLYVIVTAATFFAAPYFFEGILGNPLLWILTVMLVVALTGMPLVIAYTAYVYRVFMGKLVITKDAY